MLGINTLIQFFSLMTLPLVFIMAVTALLNYKKDSDFEL